MFAYEGLAILNRNDELAFERNTSVLQLDREGVLINGFHEPWPEDPMNSERGVDDDARNSFCFRRHI